MSVWSMSDDDVFTLKTLASELSLGLITWLQWCRTHQTGTYIMLNTVRQYIILQDSRPYTEELNFMSSYAELLRKMTNRCQVPVELIPDNWVKKVTRNWRESWSIFKRNGKTETLRQVSLIFCLESGRRCTAFMTIWNNNKKVEKTKIVQGHSNRGFIIFYDFEIWTSASKTWYFENTSTFIYSLFLSYQ